MEEDTEPLALMLSAGLVLALTVVKVTRGMTGHERDAPGLYGASVPDPEKVSP